MDLVCQKQAVWGLGLHEMKTSLFTFGESEYEVKSNVQLFMVFF